MRVLPRLYPVPFSIPRIIGNCKTQTLYQTAAIQYFPAPLTFHHDSHPPGHDNAVCPDEEIILPEDGTPPHDRLIPSGSALTAGSVHHLFDRLCCRRSVCRPDIPRGTRNVKICVMGGLAAIRHSWFEGSGDMGSDTGRFHLVLVSHMPSGTFFLSKCPISRR